MCCTGIELCVAQGLDCVVFSVLDGIGGKIFWPQPDR